MNRDFLWWGFPQHLIAITIMMERTHIHRLHFYHECQPPDEDCNYAKEMNHHSEQAPEFLRTLSEKKDLSGKNTQTVQSTGAKS